MNVDFGNPDSLMGSLVDRAWRRSMGSSETLACDGLILLAMASQTVEEARERLATAVLAGALPAQLMGLALAMDHIMVRDVLQDTYGITIAQAVTTGGEFGLDAKKGLPLMACLTLQSTTPTQPEPRLLRRAMAWGDDPHASWNVDRKLAEYLGVDKKAWPTVSWLETAVLSGKGGVAAGLLVGKPELTETQTQRVLGLGFRGLKNSLHWSGSVKHPPSLLMAERDLEKLRGLLETWRTHTNPWAVTDAQGQPLVVDLLHQALDMHAYGGYDDRRRDAEAWVDWLFAAEPPSPLHFGQILARVLRQKAESSRHTPWSLDAAWLGKVAPECWKGPEGVVAGLVQAVMRPWVDTNSPNSPYHSPLRNDLAAFFAFASPERGSLDRCLPRGAVQLADLASAWRAIGKPLSSLLGRRDLLLQLDTQWPDALKPTEGLPFARWHDWLVEAEAEEAGKVVGQLGAQSRARQRIALEMETPIADEVPTGGARRLRL